MEIVKNKLVKLNDQEYKYSDFRENLARITGNQWAELFKQFNITIPRKINTSALRVVLNSKIKDAKNLNLTDELLYRLRFYPDFSEYQLASFLLTLDDRALENLYRRYFVELLLDNKDQLNLTDEFFAASILLDTLPMESLTGYIEAIDSISYDFVGEFDGVNIPDLKEALEKSATAKEIREIGNKYGLNIPKRLKKEEMLAIIVAELKQQGKFTNEIYEKLRKSSIVILQRYAKNYGIAVSVDLMKTDLIAFLFTNLQSTDLYTTGSKIEGLELEPHGEFVFDLSYVLNDAEKNNHLAYLNTRVLDDQKSESVSKEDLERLVTDLTSQLSQNDNEGKDNSDVLAKLKETESMLNILNQKAAYNINNERMSSFEQSVLNEKINSLIAQLETRNDELSDLKASIAALKETGISSKVPADVDSLLSIKDEQIAELKEEIRNLKGISDLEHNSSKLAEELENLKQEYSKATNELTSLKEKYENLDTKSSSESESLSRELRQVKELLARQKDRNNLLEAKNIESAARYRRNLAEKDQQIFILKSGESNTIRNYLDKYNDLSNVLDSKEKELSSVKELSLQELEQERTKNSSLKSLITDLETQISSLKAEKASLLDDSDSSKYELNNLIKQKDSEIELLQNKYNSLESQISSNSSATDGLIASLKEQISELNKVINDNNLKYGEEKVRLESSLNEKNIELEALQIKYNDLSSTHLEINESNDNLVNSLKDQLLDLNTKLTNKDLEYTEAKANLEASYNTKASDLETEIANLNSENSKLKEKASSDSELFNSRLIQKEEEIAGLKANYERLQSSLATASDASDIVVANLKQQVEDLTDKLTNKDLELGQVRFDLSNKLNEKETELNKVRLELNASNQKVKDSSNTEVKQPELNSDKVSLDTYNALQLQNQLLSTELNSARVELEQLRSMVSSKDKNHQIKYHNLESNSKVELNLEKAKSESLEQEVKLLKSQISKFKEDDGNNFTIGGDSSSIISELEKQLNELIRLELLYKQRIIELEALIPTGSSRLLDDEMLQQAENSNRLNVYDYERTSPLLTGRSTLENPPHIILNERKADVYNGDFELVLSSCKYGPLQKSEKEAYLEENQANKHYSFSTKLATDPLYSDALFEDHFILNIPLGDLEVSLKGLSKKEIKQRQANIQKAIDSGNHQRLTADDWLFLNAQIRLATYEKLLTTREMSGKKKKKPSKSRINLAQLKEVQTLRNEVIRLSEINNTYKKMVDDITTLTLKDDDIKTVFDKDPFMMKTKLEALEKRYLRLYQTNACVKFHKKYSMKAAGKKKYSVCKNLNENFCHVFTPEFDVNSVNRLKSPNFDKKSKFKIFAKNFFITLISVCLIFLLFATTTFLVAWLAPYTRETINSWPIISDLINWLFKIFKLL